MAVTMRESKRHPQNQAAALLTACLFVAAVLQPGVLIGAAITLAWWRWLPTSLAGRVVDRRDRRPQSSPSRFRPSFGRGLGDSSSGSSPRNSCRRDGRCTIPATAIALSLLAEAFAGPAWATGVVLIRWTREGMPSGMIEKERRRLEERRSHVKNLQPSAKPPEPSGVLRLGVEGRRGDVDIELPMDLAQHVTVMGKMGSGKTTTAARLMEAAAMAGWPVVVVDAKGFGSLRTVAARFAERFGATFRLVAPDDPTRFGTTPVKARRARSATSSSAPSPSVRAPRSTNRSRKRSSPSWSGRSAHRASR